MSTDHELFKMALDDLEWAKLVIRLYSQETRPNDYEILDETISAIRHRLESRG